MSPGECARQDLRDELVAGEPGSHRRIGRENHIVQVGASRRLPLRLQHSDDLERHVPDLDLLPDRVLSWEQVVHHGLTEQGDLLHRADVGCIKVAPAGHVPVTDRLVLDRHAVHPGAPVPLAPDDLSARYDYRGHRGEQKGLTLQLLDVVDVQPVEAARSV